MDKALACGRHKCEGWNVSQEHSRLMFKAVACRVPTGNSHPELAQAVADRLGIPLCRSTVKKFSDNETSVQIGESVREEDVYIIQVCCSCCSLAGL